MLRAALLAVCLLLAPACTALKGDPRVLVTSTPAGAAILVNGEDTGLTTPAMVDLGGFFGGDHEIALELEGRDTERRWVRHHSTAATSRWNDGADPNLLGITLPLFWTFGDWFLPFEVQWRYTPHEVHAVLYDEGEAPVHSDGGS